MSLEMYLINKEIIKAHRLGNTLRVESLCRIKAEMKEKEKSKKNNMNH